MIAQSAFAGVREETRTRMTGNDEVLSVSNCSFPTEYYDLANNARIKSEFVVTLCREKEVYKVEVEFSEKWYNWSTSETRIEGTESFSYVTSTNTKGSDQLKNPEDPVQMFSVKSACNELRKAYLNQVIDMKDSQCAQ